MCCPPHSHGATASHSCFRLPSAARRAVLQHSASMAFVLPPHKALALVGHLTRWAHAGPCAEDEGFHSELMEWFAVLLSPEQPTAQSISLSTVRGLFLSVFAGFQGCLISSSGLQLELTLDGDISCHCLGSEVPLPEHARMHASAHPCVLVKKVREESMWSPMSKVDNVAPLPIQPNL